MTRRSWEALLVVGEHDSEFRVLLLGQLAEELYYSSSAERRLGLSEEAVAIARRLGGPRTVSFAPVSRCLAAWDPDRRGRTLTSHEVIVELIGSTRTRTGLQVHAELDPGFYATGIKISDRQFSALKQQQIRQHSFHGDWNCTVVPANQLRIDNYE